MLRKNTIVDSELYRKTLIIAMPSIESYMGVVIVAFVFIESLYIMSLPFLTISLFMLFALSMM